MRSWGSGTYTGFCHLVFSVDVLTSPVGSPPHAPPPTPQPLGGPFYHLAVETQGRRTCCLAMLGVLAGRSRNAEILSLVGGGLDGEGPVPVRGPVWVGGVLCLPCRNDAAGGRDPGYGYWSGAGSSQHQAHLEVGVGGGWGAHGVETPSTSSLALQGSYLSIPIF